MTVIYAAEHMHAECTLTYHWRDTDTTNHDETVTIHHGYVMIHDFGTVRPLTDISLPFMTGANR